MEKEISIFNVRAKILKDFPNYAALETGEIYSLLGNRKLKGSLTNSKKGYKFVCIRNINNIKKSMLVHRLVALAFIPNPKNKRVVNHIDGNKLNNKLSNLEWNTDSENVRHSFNIGTQVSKFGGEHHRSKIVYQFNLDGTLIKKWDCLMDIQRETSFSISHISQCCTGKRNTHYKFLWSFKNTNEGIKKKYCVYCNKKLEFNIKVREHKYCSRICKYRYSHPIIYYDKTCTICIKTFKTIFIKSFLCSKDCRLKHRRLKEKARRLNNK